MKVPPHLLLQVDLRGAELKGGKDVQNFTVHRIKVLRFPRIRCVSERRTGANVDGCVRLCWSASASASVSLPRYIDIDIDIDIEYATHEKPQNPLRTKLSSVFDLNSMPYTSPADGDTN
jgi:hypothetical protein